MVEVFGEKESMPELPREWTLYLGDRL